jgi:CubicO group peptidase (beta-lactamase class C family)
MGRYVQASTRLVLPLVLISLISTGCSGASTASASVSKTWPYSTPEEQGMDSELLAQAAAQIGSKHINLHSMIVIRHGKIVVEKYFGSFTGDQTVAVYSVTKGVVAALIGIAINQGSIDNVNHKVLDYFPNLTIDNNDANKQAITIENLLTMSSGFAWSDDTDINKMMSSGSQVQYVLDLPMAAAPGKKFNYDTGAPGLLCAILLKATGISPTDFAIANLFDPLGLTDISWGKDSSGLETGGFGITMSPRDMAVLGQLYLRGGEWNGKQVIPASWVKASLESHIDPMMQSEKRSGYGYLLWLQTHGAISFHGAFGQYITMVPAQDLEVVFTADLTGENFQQPYDVFESYILPAVKSNDPLPANPAAAAKLEAALKALQ